MAGYSRTHALRQRIINTVRADKSFASSTRQIPRPGPPRRHHAPAGHAPAAPRRGDPRCRRATARETGSRWPWRIVRTHLQHGGGRSGSAQQQGEGGAGCLVLRHLSRRRAECTFLSVHVVAREPGGREGATMTDYDHASLSRQACGALSEHWLAGGPAGAWRHSFGSCNTCELELLLDAFESRDGDQFSARSVKRCLRRCIRRSQPLRG